MTPDRQPTEAAALPNTLPRPAGELARLQRAWAPPSGWRILSAVNNTHIGLFYIGTSLLFFVLAGVLALMMRAQLIGGVVFPVFAALYHWTPLVNGQLLSDRVAHWVCGLMFGGFNLAFFPMHVAGLLGMPRRVYTYDSGLGLDLLNLLSSIGAFVFAAGVLLFFIDAVRTWTRTPGPAEDPWQAGTLEWLPNDDYGTRSIPQVHSRSPMWDQPGLAREVQAGQHWLPGSVTGQRETILTSVRHARLGHVLVLPGDGWLPLIAGVGTAGFFLLLTVKMVMLACVFGLGGLAAMLAWVWGSDRAVDADDRTQAEVGTGVSLPVGASGRHSHSWWATVILVVVDATIFASMLFAHLHVSMRATVCPPPGARLPDTTVVASSVALGLVALAALLLAGRCRLDTTTRRSLLAMTGLVAVAAAATVASFALLWFGHVEAGLAPRATAWGATVAALLGWQGFHAVVLMVMAAYLVARRASGLLTPRRRATLDNITLFWQYGIVQGIVIALFVQWLPLFMK